MSVAWQVKVEQLHEAVTMLTRDFRVIPLGEAARQLHGSTLPERNLDGRSRSPVRPRVDTAGLPR